MPYTTEDNLDFDQFVQLYTELKAFGAPSELHGVLCGRLAGGDLDENGWLTLAATLLEQARIESDDNKRMLLSLYGQAQAQLQGPGFEFRLLIPDDEWTIAERAQALSSWCRGYVAGLDMYSDIETGLSEETAESLQDLRQIGEMEDDPEESEDSERDFFNLDEYVRMVVIMIYSELNVVVDEAAQASPDSHH